jgi:sec-independent protein translocase protein TatB
VDFLGIGPLELMFVILIALIVIGPKDMSKTARTAGRTLNRMYRSEAWRSLTQASRTLQTLPNRLAREAQLEELEELRKDLDNKPQPDLAQNPSLKPWVTPYDAPEKFQTIAPPAPPAPPAHAQAAKPKTAQPARKKPPATTAGKPSASKKSGAGKSTKRSKKPSSGPKKGSTPSSKSGGARRKASSATPPQSSTSGRSSSSRSKPTGRSGH